MAVAALTLTGCGGSNKNAREVAAQAPPAAQATSTSRQPPTARPTVTGTVKAGGYCTVKGAVAKTVQGHWATCTTRSGETRLRWVEVSGTQSGGAVVPGAYCSQEGATGKSASGNNYTCGKRGSDTHARWHRS